MVSYTLDKTTHRILDSSGNVICLGMDYKPLEGEVAMNEITITQYDDGIYVNAFYYEGQWQFCSSHVEDPDKLSYRTPKGRRSLNQLISEFEGMISLLGRLNKDNQYGFLLIHPDLTMTDKVRLIHLMTRTPDSYTVGFEESELEMETPRQIETEHSEFADFENWIKTGKNFPYSMKGVTIWKGQQSRHIVRECYNDIKKAAMTPHNLEYEVLRLHVEKRENAMEGLMKWGGKTGNLEKILKTLDKLKVYIGDVANIYHKVFVKKEHVDIPKNMKATIYSLHQLYLRQKNMGDKILITEGVVEREVMKMDVPLLYTLVCKVH